MTSCKIYLYGIVGTNSKMIKYAQMCTEKHYCSLLLICLVSHSYCTRKHCQGNNPNVFYAVLTSQVDPARKVIYFQQA